jgi:rhamnosyltransferase
MKPGPEGALRLLAERERRLLGRLRRRAWRLLRRAWRLLPLATRDRLRPVLLRMLSAPPTAAVPAPAPPRRRAVSSPALLPRVSLLIPTLNGNRDFELLLAAIARQEGLADPELIVVDSGSADGTPEAASRAGARVVSIPGEEFGHGTSRNAAAEAASGSVFVLLVQDALPLGPTALRDLVDELLSNDGLAAVSARQVPRSDADLYAAFVVYAHELAVRRPGTSSEVARAAASVDNVCAAVRRAAWEETPFADVPFAEDLDFGVRARARGWSLRTSTRAAVAHSHNRPAGYHLRRNVADRIHVAPLVGENRVPRTAGAGASELIPAALALFGEVEAAAMASKGEAPLALHLASIRSVLEVGAPRITPTGELAAAAELLTEDARGEPAIPLARDLRRQLVRLLASDPVSAFAAAHRHVAADSAAGFAAKAAAALVGQALGDALRLRPDPALTKRLLTGL